MKTYPCILKVSFEGEIRRLRTFLPDLKAVGSKLWLDAFRDEVRHGLGSSADSEDATERIFNLRYKTFDGKMVLLTEATCRDYLAASAADCKGEILLRISADGAVLMSPPIPNNVVTKGNPGETLLTHQRRGKREQRQTCSSCQKPSGQETLWTSVDGSATITVVETPYKGRQPRLQLGKHAFLVRIKTGDHAAELPFDASAEHISVMERMLTAIQLLAPSLSKTPGWHSLPAGSNSCVALQLCYGFQLCLCLKHSPSGEKLEKKSLPTS